MVAREERIPKAAKRKDGGGDGSSPEREILPGLRSGGVGSPELGAGKGVVLYRMYFYRFHF